MSQIPWGLGLRPKLGQSAVVANHQLEATMLSIADHTETSIRTDLRAIFVSLELSRTIWLITSLSPGTREKMSKHSVPAGDIDGFLCGSDRSKSGCGPEGSSYHRWSSSRRPGSKGSGSIEC
jgi:hypothetical protein